MNQDTTYAADHGLSLETLIQRERDYKAELIREALERQRKKPVLRRVK